VRSFLSESSFSGEERREGREQGSSMNGEIRTETLRAPEGHAFRVVDGNVEIDTREIVQLKPGLGQLYNDAANTQATVRRGDKDIGDMAHSSLFKEGDTDDLCGEEGDHLFVVAGYQDEVIGVLQEVAQVVVEELAGVGVALEVRIEVGVIIHELFPEEEEGGQVFGVSLIDRGVTPGEGELVFEVRTKEGAGGGGEVTKTKREGVRGGLVGFVAETFFKEETEVFPFGGRGPGDGTFGGEHPYFKAVRFFRSRVRTVTPKDGAVAVERSHAMSKELVRGSGPTNRSLRRLEDGNKEHHPEAVVEQDLDQRERGFDVCGGVKGVDEHQPWEADQAKGGQIA
jgi:hypothetical protein